MKYRVIERFGNADKRFVVQSLQPGPWPFFPRWVGDIGWPTLKGATDYARHMSDGFRVVWP